jgi:hypothetical protein
LGSRNWEDHDLKPAWAKSLEDPHLNQCLGVEMPVSPVMCESTNRRIKVRKAWAYHKNNQYTKKELVKWLK